ncbi:MAG: formate/nitrite transporter family protein [Culicoidibacterales bacterium]
MAAGISLMEKIEGAGKKKIELVEKSWVRYLIRAMLAGLFLTLATSMAMMVGDKLDHIAHGLGKFTYALFFGWALVMILYMNSELGTSNMMYFSANVAMKKAKVSQAAKVIGLCVLGNLIGAILFAWITAQTSTFQNLPADHFMFTAVAAKLAKTPWQIFFEGILANVVVNTAVIATINMKEDGAKVLSMVFIVFIFAFLGYEHVIANFSSFSLAFFASGGAVEGMTMAATLTNLIVAFIGNFVGGGFVIGLTYVFLNKGEYYYKD